MRISVFVKETRCTVQIILATVVLGLVTIASRAQSFTDIKPSPQQVEWQDLEYGVLIHFGTNTFLDREWGNGTASPQIFNPTEFDAEQWMRAIHAAGASTLFWLRSITTAFASGLRRKRTTASRAVRGKTARAT